VFRRDFGIFQVQKLYDRRREKYVSFYVLLSPPENDLVPVYSDTVDSSMVLVASVPLDTNIEA
jgi:hypothetical protein